jgi:putative chitinase
MRSSPAENRERDAFYLTEAMKAGDISSVTRAAAFIAQIAHESGELKYFEELASGEAYENRQDLGNHQPGDGKKYKGRGPIQLTGRLNYRVAGQSLNLPLEDEPQLVANPEVGFLTSVWYWSAHKLNDKADKLDFVGITRAINGGLTHHDKRMAYYFRALEVFGRRAKVG